MRTAGTQVLGGDATESAVPARPRSRAAAVLLNARPPVRLEPGERRQSQTACRLLNTKRCAVSLSRATRSPGLTKTCKSFERADWRLRCVWEWLHWRRKGVSPKVNVNAPRA